MAKIRGIDIKLGVNTAEVTDGFNKINAQLKETDKVLRDVEKGLKLDPNNVELLAQKTKYLEKAISESATKLEEEKKILKELDKLDGGSGKYAEQMDAVKREIEATTQKQAKYEKELELTKTRTEEVGTATDKMGDSFLKSSLKVEAIKAGCDIAVKALGKVVDFVGNAIKASSEYADAILTEATVTGLSTDALQEYRYMAELVDVSVDTITGSLTKLTKQMYSAKDGTGATAQYFKQLGVSVTDADGNLRDSQDVFNEVIESLGGLENETERDAIAMAIFGKSAQELNPLIAQGAEGLEAFKQEAHDIGYVLDEETLSALGAVDDAFQRFSLFSEAIMNQVGAVLAPVITDITDRFVAWAQSVDWEEVGQKIATFVQGAIAVIEAITPIVSDVISTIINIVKSLWEFFGQFWEFCKLVWDGVVKTIEGAKNALAPVIDGIVAIFQKIVDVINTVVGKISDFVGAIGGAISKAGEFLNGVGDKIGNFFGSFGGLFNSGGYASGGFASGGYAYASGGYNLTTNVTIQNYANPVSGALADQIAEMVNDRLGKMIR